VLSVSPLRSTFTGALAAALIGDVYSPLEWLEYSRTTDARPTGRLAFVGIALVLACVVARIVVRAVRARKRRCVRGATP